MKARRREKTRQKPDMGLLSLVLILIVMTIIGSLLGDAKRVPFGQFGGFVWATALVVSFMFGLLYFAQFVLSVRGIEGWSEGLRLLWRHYLLQAQVYLNTLFQPEQESRLRRIQSTTPLSDPNRLPASFKLLGAGVVRSNQVLALSRGVSFSRAAGPGFVTLYTGESISHVIDLRKHVRSTPVKANTRDGIPVETNVSVVFRVRQSPLEQVDESAPYPYDRDAIFHVTYANSVDGNDRILPWTEQLAPKAAALLVAELAKYTLDELYQVNDTNAAPLDEIKQEMARQLEQDAESMGIELLGVGISHFSLPSSVAGQYVKTWQARWERELQVQRAVTDAEAERRIKKARARVQIEIIESITQNIETMRRAEGASLTEIIMLRMIEVLEEAVSDTALQQAGIPERIMSNLVVDTSDQMRQWIANTGEES